MVMHSMLAGIAFCFKTMSDKAEQIKWGLGFEWSEIFVP